MKKLLIIIFVFFSIQSKAQEIIVLKPVIIHAKDTLSMRSGENILVKVIEVGATEVKFKKLDNLNGPIFSILKSDLLMIRYENGTKEDFSSVEKIEENNFSRIDAADRGKMDAQEFYNGYKDAGTVALISSIPLITIPLSLPFSIAASLTIPTDKNLNYPNISLMENEKYANSYRKEAKKIKSQKIWKNLKIGLGIGGVGASIFLINFMNPN